jgi:hypothetical protein
MKMFDKVLAIGIVLTVCGVSLKAAISTENKTIASQKEKTEKTVIKESGKQATIDYEQVRKDYQWDLEGASDLGETFRSWD